MVLWYKSIQEGRKRYGQEKWATAINVSDYCIEGCMERSLKSLLCLLSLWAANVSVIRTPSDFMKSAV